MARVINGTITGLVGNLVFYKRGDQQLVRSNSGPRKKKRGKPANPQNTAFTIVSTSASPMVSWLKGKLLLPVKLKTYNDVRGWILPLYEAFAQDADWPLAERNMCQLNPSLDLRDYLQVRVEVSNMGNGQVGVSIPSLNPVQQIKAPLRTYEVRIKVIVVAAGFSNMRPLPSLAADQYEFAYSNTPIPAKDFVLNTGTTKGTVAMVVVAVEYAIAASNMYSSELQHLPAAIVAIGRL